VATIVKGHGARVDDKETFVPTGTTVKMYSGFDVDLATSAALVGIASGSFASPVDSATGPNPIANYQLFTQDDRFYAQWVAMGQASSNPIWWVGQDLDDQIRLCNEDGTCDASTGTHDCSGVFGQVHAPEIVLLACRGHVGTEDGGVSTGYGSDAEHPLSEFDSEMDEWFGKFITRATADPDAAEREYDALPQGTQALALASGSGNAFAYGRWVRRYALDDNLDDLFTHFRTNVANVQNIMWWLDNVAPYGQALDAAVARHPGNFKDFVEEVGDPWQAALMARPAISTAIHGVVNAEGETIDWGDFEDRNRDYVKNLGEGAGAAFWQHGETLVIGGQYRSPYGTRILEAGGAEGTLTMVSRGGTLSRGKVQVTGAADQDAFRRAFARLSQKSVEFA
jgi:hypothetical protein